MKASQRGAWMGAGLGALALLVTSGCKRSEPPAPVAVPRTPEAVVDFPAGLRAEDESVNAFVRRVIGTCVAGDYEGFRLLWSAAEDPFPRDAFERGWRAVKRVRILDLQPGKLEHGGEIIYAVHARVELDESVAEPERQVVLVLVKENDRWRLRSAPARLRERYLGAEVNETNAATTAPSGPAGPTRRPLPRRLGHRPRIATQPVSQSETRPGNRRSTTIHDD